MENIKETLVSQSSLEKLVQPTRFKYGFVIFFIVMHLAMIQGIFFFSWGAVITAIIIYVLGAIGLSAGYHRGLAHRSFTASRPVMYVLVSLGMLQLVGGPVSWVGMHHIHHAYSDTEIDPHSSKKGFFWAHVGWAIRTTQEFYRRFAAKHISQDWFYRFCDTFFLLPQIILGVFLWLIGGWTYVVWGIFMRIPLHWHATFSVNSFAHWFGYKNYPNISKDDQSRNNWWVSIVTLGEGWHNNHHHDKRAAYYGRRWWEIDPVGGIILLLEKLRLVRQVVPAMKK